LPFLETLHRNMKGFLFLYTIINSTRI